MGLRERLENLVANPLVVDSTDYDFAKGLLEYYNKKGHLTSGRRPWLDKLEAKYDPTTYVDPIKGNPQGEQIVKLLEREDVASRDRSFLESLKGAVARWGKLTDRQAAALERITERYSEEGKQRRAAWNENYAARRDEAVIAANYYAANPPYYGDLAERILTEPDFVPTEKQFNAITQNKYAQKVIKAAQAPALYPEGTMVEGRAGGNYRFRGKKGFVLKTDHGPITNAAKGVKKYLVLPIGEPAPIVIEEREIKRVKKIKK
tara:strand:+ start:509 stop:1294 length:786 start_codon:yes stop_codon:yes gene_type:complete